MRVELLQLLTSPDHNYVGHHGRPSDDFPMVAHDEIELVEGRGIRGDRFFDWKQDFKGQITFIDEAVVEAVRDHAGNPALPAAAFRRNVLIAGADLNSLIGREFRLGEVLLSGSEECRPCYWMDEACGKPGTEELMKGRGGLRCRILRSGTLFLGETELHPA